ncbi:MAG: universal stress protein [Gammaproteobacteria bacterium]|nr:universal stress protein [Gammaproteobacteria bacterium]
MKQISKSSGSLESGTIQTHAGNEIRTEEILKKADQLNFDLIIMGTHKKGVTHTFLGSVTKSMLHRSRIPTLAVPLPEKL